MNPKLCFVNNQLDCKIIVTTKSWCVASILWSHKLLFEHQVDSQLTRTPKLWFASLPWTVFQKSILYPFRGPQYLISNKNAMFRDVRDRLQGRVCAFEWRVSETVSKECPRRYVVLVFVASVWPRACFFRWLATLAEDATSRLDVLKYGLLPNAFHS